MSFALIALGAVGLVAAQASETPKLTAECVDTVIFFARGNDAPYHDGRTTPFLDATCAKLVAEGKTCDYIDIQFDVTLGGPYCTQVGEGDANGISQITAFQAQCPCTHIVVGGYSEGANVVGDVLSGGACNPGSTGIDATSAAGKAIAAAVVWGDPRHTAGQSYNVLDGAALEAAPRDADSLARLQGYASVLRNYCAAGDPICAGGDNITQHLDYFDLYTDDAATWVVGKVDAAAPLCDASTSTISSAAASSVAANSVTITAPSTTAQAAISVPTVANTSTAIPMSTAATAYSLPIPLYTASAANSTASIATPAPYPIVNGSMPVSHTTIQTIVSKSLPDGGYAHAAPTTIVTVSVTQTVERYATVSGVGASQSQGGVGGYAVPSSASVSKAAPQGYRAGAGSEGSKVPEAPVVSQGPAGGYAGVEVGGACGVVTKTVYL